MADIEVRELEYFVAVAEELHFARAAERLHIVQPALSRAVQRLESRLGVVLLIRNSRNVALTPAGTALLYHARQVLDAVARATDSTRSAQGRSDPLRLVLKPGGDGGLLPPILAAWEARPGVPRVDIVFGGSVDRVDHLRDGRADLAIVYDPLDDVSGLETVTLVREERVAVLPSGHRLAARDEIRMSDLAGETMARWQGVPGNGDGPEVSSMAEFAVVVALGRAVTVLPASTVGLLTPDAITVPIADATPSRTMLAWVAGNETAGIRAFARTAHTVVRGRDTADGLAPRAARRDGSCSAYRLSAGT